MDFLSNLALGGDKGTNMAYFGRVQAAVDRKKITVCGHDFAVKYTTATRALTGGIFKILS